MNIIQNIPIYYINLENSTLRNERIIKMFDMHKITNYKRIEAIYGKNLDLDTLNLENRAINPNVLGCTLSHIKAIKQAFDDNCEYALILEDDCNFEYLKYKKKPMLEYFSEKKDCEILQLGLCCKENNNIRILNEKDEIFKGFKNCATGYLINRNGMIKIINAKDKKLKEADYYIYECANTYYCKPYLTYYYSHVQKSDIHINTLYSREDSSKRFWDEYYLKSKNYKLIMVILDSNNLDIYDYNREIYKRYMNSNPEILSFFVKYDENIKTNIYISIEESTIYIRGKEEFTGKAIFNKTKEAIKYIYETYKFDYLLRTNISSFWVFPNLLAYLNTKVPDHIFGIKMNTICENEKIDFISGTGIFIPYKLINLLINHNFTKYNDDDIEISYIYANNGIILRDSRRSNASFMYKFEEKTIEDINEKIKKIPENVVYFRIKNNNRDILDKYILNFILKKYYNIDRVFFIKNKILEMKNKKNYIYVSKKAYSFSKFIVDLLLENLNLDCLTHDRTHIKKSDIIITHICDRVNDYNEDSINIIISGESNTKSTYDQKFDISITPVNNFVSYYNLYFPYLYNSLTEHKKSINNLDYINSKEKFCAFMYFVDYEHRINIFKKISEYKKVDALGKSQKNINLEDSRFICNSDENFNDIAVKIYSHYKFVIAVENNMKDGYFTEKIINPLIANSIPIYWGYPSVFKYINKKRVVYINDFQNLDSLVEYIKFLDNNDIEYNKIINEPIFLENKEPTSILSDIKNKIRNIFKNFI
jgi:GR25 family glycosyltransferase involved in LPS biosynthesis